MANKVGLQKMTKYVVVEKFLKKGLCAAQSKHHLRITIVYLRIKAYQKK